MNADKKRRPVRRAFFLDVVNRFFERSRRSKSTAFVAKNALAALRRPERRVRASNVLPQICVRQNWRRRFNNTPEIGANQALSVGNILRKNRNLTRSPLLQIDKRRKMSSVGKRRLNFALLGAREVSTL